MKLAQILRETRAEVAESSRKGDNLGALLPKIESRLRQAGHDAQSAAQMAAPLLWTLCASVQESALVVRHGSFDGCCFSNATFLFEPFAPLSEPIEATVTDH